MASKKAATSAATTAKKSAATTAATGKQRAKSSKRKPLSDEHRAALSRGRVEGAAVRRYLETISSDGGRRRSPDAIKAQLEKLNEELHSSELDVMRRLHALQRRRDLERDLAVASQNEDLESVEAAFVEHAANFSARHKLDYSTWREIGVPAGLLRKAGITR